MNLITIKKINAVVWKTSRILKSVLTEIKKTQQSGGAHQIQSNSTQSSETTSQPSPIIYTLIFLCVVIIFFFTLSLCLKPKKLKTTRNEEITSLNSITPSDLSLINSETHVRRPDVFQLPSIPSDITAFNTNYTQGSALMVGTVIKFVPLSGQDIIYQSGSAQTIKTNIQCITAMEEYKSKSNEELRFEHLQANNIFTPTVHLSCNATLLTDSESTASNTTIPPTSIVNNNDVEHPIENLHNNASFLADSESTSANNIIAPIYNNETEQHTTMNVIRCYCMSTDCDQCLCGVQGQKCTTACHRGKQNKKCRNC